MIKYLTNAKTSNHPLKLIQIVIDAATKFDEESTDESQLVIEHAEALAFFCGQMSSLRPDDEALQKYTEDRKRQCPKVQKVSFNEDSISLDESMNSEDQKDGLRQLAASIAIQVKNTKESNRISELEEKLVWP